MNKDEQAALRAAFETYIEVPSDGNWQRVCRVAGEYAQRRRLHDYERSRQQAQRRARADPNARPDAPESGIAAAGAKEPPS